MPHSGILGSSRARRSPRHIAVRRALHRLLAPRHPPVAHSSLIIHYARTSRAAGLAFSPCGSGLNASATGSSWVWIAAYTHALSLGDFVARYSSPIPSITPFLRDLRPARTGIEDRGRQRFAALKMSSTLSTLHSAVFKVHPASLALAPSAWPTGARVPADLLINGRGTVQDRRARRPASLKTKQRKDG